MSIWRFPQALHTVGEFTAMVSTQRKQKKNQAKAAIQEKKKENVNPLFDYSERYYSAKSKKNARMTTC